MTLPLNKPNASWCLLLGLKWRERIDEEVETFTNSLNFRAFGSYFNKNLQFDKIKRFEGYTYK